MRAIGNVTSIERNKDVSTKQHYGRKNIDRGTLLIYSVIRFVQLLPVIFISTLWGSGMSHVYSYYRRIHLTNTRDESEIKQRRHEMGQTMGFLCFRKETGWETGTEKEPSSKKNQWWSAEERWWRIQSGMLYRRYIWSFVIRVIGPSDMQYTHVSLCCISLQNNDPFKRPDNKVNVAWDFLEINMECSRHLCSLICILFLIKYHISFFLFFSVNMLDSPFDRTSRLWKNDIGAYHCKTGRLLCLGN